jgi:hypothetical protein
MMLVAALGTEACCAEGPPILTIWLSPTRDWSDPESSRCDWETIGWGGSTECPPGWSVLVIYQSSDSEGEIRRTAVELYDGDGRVPLEESTSMDHSCHHGCPSPRTLYLLDVPEGEYTLVHRESTGTGKPVHTPGAGEDPWTEFEGERALVTTLTIAEPTDP